MKSQKEHLGKKIKRLRAYRGLTQEGLAEELGKTRSLVSFLERTGNINKYTLEEIAKILGVTVEELNDAPSTSIAQEPTSYKSIEHHTKLIEQLKKENEFLKETIQHQWELLKALSSKSNRDDISHDLPPK